MIFTYDKDRIYFALNLHSLREREYYQCPIEENLPCWHPHDGMLIYVYTTIPRITDLIRYSVHIPTELSFGTIRDFYEEIWSVLCDNGYTNDKAYELEIVIASSSEVYCLTKSGIIDRDNKLTPVFGDIYTELSAAVPKDLPPIDRIKAYYRLENDFLKRKSLPIILLSTDENGAKLVDL